MFSVNFFIENESESHMLSGFELGHIEFMCNEKIGSSFGKTPDQSMMIFLTLINLLSGLFEFKVKELELVFIDRMTTANSIKLDLLESLEQVKSIL